MIVIVIVRVRVVAIAQGVRVVVIKEGECRVCSDGHQRYTITKIIGRQKENTSQSKCV